MNAVAPEKPAGSFDEESAARRVLALVRELTVELHPGMPGIDRLNADASLERDFGLDSLARVELAHRVEQALAVEMPEAALAESETVRDLARALVHAGGAVPAIAACEPHVVVEVAGATAPPLPSTLIDALEWHSNEHPQRTHILLVNRDIEPERVSFGDLRKSAVSIAAGLKRRGIRPGEAVAILLPTGREFFAAFYGALYAQAVPVPLYPPARPSQIETHLRRVAGILANCEARILLTFDRAKAAAHLLRSLGTRLETIATLEDIAETPATWPAPHAVPGDTAFLQYTSGSTGQPKGVVLTHANLLANLSAMQRVTGVTSADCFVSWLPLYHDMGLIGACFGALVVGYPLVLMSPFAFLSHPVHWLRAIERHRATITAAPNFAYELALSKINEQELAGLDLSSLRLVFNGAEAVSPQTVERFATRFAQYGLHREALMPVYGLAESALGLAFPPVGRGPQIDTIVRERFLRAGVASIAPENEAAPLRFVSCGAPLPGHLIRIVNERGAPLPERTQGHIEFQGPSATSGYFHNPQETARLFDGLWLDTGDLGYLANGELHVTGRAKDLIIRGGHHIHPQELEEAVAQLPGIRKGGAAVFPAADRRSGTERIVVLAETREDRSAERAQLISHINRLAVDLIGFPVDEVVLAPPRTVLKTSSGKIRRSACREAYERGELGASGRAPWLQWMRLILRAFIARTARALRRLIEIAWGVWAWGVSVCFAPLLWLSLILTPGLARRRRIAVAVLRLVLRLCGVSVRIQKPVKTTAGPRVFVANHASYLDGVLLLTTLPTNVAFVAKREFARAFAIGRVLRRMGSVFVERYDLHTAAGGVHELEAHLRAGESLVVFAEGTFRRDPGLLPFHMGAFSAAAATGAVVVPIALCGTRSLLPDGALVPRRTVIDLIIGEPLLPEDTGWHTAVKLRQCARQHILSHIHEPDLEQSAPRGPS